MPLQQGTFNTCDNSLVSNSQSFEEQKFVVVRRHGSALVLPSLILCVVGFLFFFVEWRLPELWQRQAFLAICIILSLIFWLVPSIKFFTNRYELTSTRAIVRSGLFGTKREEAPWGEVTGVSVSRGVAAWLQGAGDIRLNREFGQDLILKGTPKAKKLAKEIEQFLSKRAYSGMRK